MLGHISPAPVRLTPLAPGGRLPVVCAECSYRHHTPRGPAYPPGVRPRSSRPRHHPAARNRLLLCCCLPHVRNDGWLWVAGIDYQAWAYTVWTFFFSHDTWAWLGFELYLGWEGCGGPIFWMAAAAAAAPQNRAPLAPAAPVMLATLAVSALLRLAAAGKTCTFEPNCDFGKGSRDSAPATSKEQCCTLCQQSSGCVAGVWDGAHCWFKPASAVAHGCTHSARSKFACLTAAAPTPPTPPPPPSPEFYALEKQYTDLMSKSCAAAAAKAPGLSQADETAFTTAYAHLAENRTDTAPVLSAAAKLLDSANVKAFLSLPDSFGAGGLDASLVLCSVLRQATPAGAWKRPPAPPPWREVVPEQRSTPRRPGAVCRGGRDRGGGHLPAAGRLHADARHAGGGRHRRHLQRQGWG
jgi:hypothetical protein